MKLSVKLLYGLIICALSPGMALSADLPDTIDRIRSSVVAVGTVKPARGLHKKGPPVIFKGTGFVVGNGRQVITNHHVIPETNDLEDKESLAIFTGRGKNAKVHKARLVRSDPDHDLALLEISGAPLPVMQLANGSSVREGRGSGGYGLPDRNGVRPLPGDSQGYCCRDNAYRDTRYFIQEPDSQPYKTHEKPVRGLPAGYRCLSRK